ncbi:MAG TPA: DUF819 family protein [Pseudomonadales bacterium]|nr:DUF819 family protein [Pseudomonadales bacterium]
MFTQTLPILAMLVALVALSEWLARRTWMRHLGAALLVIVLTAVVTNLGVIPAYGPETPLYGAIFTYIAPLGIFWLLLLVDLKSVLRVGTPMLVLFLVGALGTVAGVLAGHWAVGGASAFGDLHAPLAGMFAGTYIGGSVNFNAVAIEYGVAENPALYAGAAAVDNAMTTVWMIACVALPRLLAGFWPRPAPAAADTIVEAAPDDEIETASVFDLATVIALGMAAVVLSEALADLVEATLGVAIPATLILTTLALGLAQVPRIRRLRGARLLGLFAVYLFLAVIGALCDLEALQRMGELAPVLGVFVCVLVAVHGLLVFGAARILGYDLATAAVASQANIGGGATALALARGLGRADLELPAILVGAVGLVLGNYLGFLVVALLA